MRLTFAPEDFKHFKNSTTQRDSVDVLNDLKSSSFNAAYEIRKKKEPRSTAKEEEKERLDALMRPTLSPDELKGVLQYTTVQSVVNNYHQKPSHSGRNQQETSQVDAIIQGNQGRFSDDPFREEQDKVPTQRHVFKPKGAVAAVKF